MQTVGVCMYRCFSSIFWIIIRGIIGGIISHIASATFQAIDEKLKLSYLLMISKLFIVMTPTESLPRSGEAHEVHHRPEAIQFKETCEDIQGEIESIITDRAKWSDLDTDIADKAVTSSTRKIEILHSLLDDYIRDNSESHIYFSRPNRGPVDNPSLMGTMKMVMADDESSADEMTGGGDEGEFKKGMDELYRGLSDNFPEKCGSCPIGLGQLKISKKKKPKKKSSKKKKASKKKKPKKKATKKKRLGTNLQAFEQTVTAAGDFFFQAT